MEEEKEKKEKKEKNLKKKIKIFFSKQKNLENDLEQKINLEETNLENFTEKMNLKDNTKLMLEKKLEEKIKEEKNYLSILNTYTNFTKSKFNKNEDHLIFFENDFNLELIDFKNFDHLNEKEKNIFIWNKKRSLIKKNNN